MTDPADTTKVLEAQTRGPQAMRYGVFGVRPVSVASATADVGAGLEADYLDSDGHDGFASADGTALLNVAAPLMAIGAGDIASARMGTAR
jgi:hypothetical protein